MTFSEELKGQLDIVDVIGQYVRLKRTGAHYKGLCPFHSEKTPSFNVHSAEQYYKCFGCDAGGDVFKFVMQLEGLTFPEALKLLAERYGIPMPARQSSSDPRAQRREMLLEIEETAAQVFQDNLRSPQGADARRYLESRGVSSQAMDEFRLGLSDGSGQQLLHRLRKYSPETLEESGLFSKRSDGSGLFDRFRGRLMFPIHSESGKVIAFGGRALRAGDEPKYLNSPSPEDGSTGIYKKSEVLYNLHRAKIDARKNDRMILVEGYMDVIGVYSAGVRDVVASCGTALSIAQVRAIKRQVSQQQSNTGQIVLNFDPDPAGARSTEKYIAVLLAEGLRVKVLELPGGVDPDEFIGGQGIDAYRTAIERAPSYFHWLAERARGKFDMHSAEGRFDAFKFMLPAIQQVSDRMERSIIATEIAEYLKVDIEMVREQFRRSRPSVAPRPARETSSAIPPNEKLLLTCLLSNAESRETIVHYLRQTNVLPLTETKAVFEAVLRMEQEERPFSMDGLLERLEPRLQRLVGQLSFAEFGVREEDAPQQTLRCLAELEKMPARSEIAELRRRVREQEHAGNFEEAMRLTIELNRASSVGAMS